MVVRLRLVLRTAFCSGLIWMGSSRYPTVSHYRVAQARKKTSHQNLLVGALQTLSDGGLSQHADIARYQTSMLRSLKEVQGDDNVVGFYQATALGAFFNQTLIDTQAIHQERLRHGGVVIVHGDLISRCGELAEIDGVDRRFANGTGERVIPGVQTDELVYGRAEEGEFQFVKVGCRMCCGCDLWMAYDL